MTQHIIYCPVKGLTTSNPTNQEAASLSYPVTVIDSGINGTSWFRKYSDGWVECGGYVAPVSIAAYEQSTVTFDVAFPNAVVFIECQPVCSATGGSDSGLYGVRDVTTTGFIFQSCSDL